MKNIFLDKNEWSKIPTLGTPPERYHHSAVVFEGSLYVFGGFQGYDDLYEYRFGSRTWSVVNTKGAPPNPRWGHRAVTVKRYMFVFGGCDLVINYNDVHRYHFGKINFKEKEILEIHYLILIIIRYWEMGKITWWWIHSRLFSNSCCV